jgi:hypothetical protein
MKIMDNEEQIQNRANWLYYYNGGQLKKLECAKQAVLELASARFVIDLRNLFGIELEDYIESIAKNIKEEK